MKASQSTESRAGEHQAVCRAGSTESISWRPGTRWEGAHPQCLRLWSQQRACCGLQRGRVAPSKEQGGRGCGLPQKGGNGGSRPLPTWHSGPGLEGGLVLRSRWGFFQPTRPLPSSGPVISKEIPEGQAVEFHPSRPLGPSAGSPQPLGV